MGLRRYPFTRTVTLAALIFATSTGFDARSQPPQTFRTGVTLVPIDVRVLDEKGRPVTDLRREDFTIFEDDVRQDIAYFEASALTPSPPAPNARLALRGESAPPLAPPKQRVFLFVFGRGRLQDPPYRAIDGAIKFVGERLLPQDQVAVLAYNRATDFSTDHPAVVQVLERFKSAHAGIEAKLKGLSGGLAAIYGSRQIPAALQADVDAVFRPMRDAVRQVAPASVPDTARMDEDARRNAQALMRADILAGRDVPPNGLEADRTFDLAAAERIDLPFDDYVEKNFGSMQDVGNIYTGIQYLRYFEGEKHLVFVTESGIFLPRLEDDKSVAARASDARVTIDVIHASGFPAPLAPTSMGSMGGPGRPMSPLPTTTMMFNHAFQIGTSRTMAEMTGGQVAAFRNGDDAFARLDLSTRFQYLLGYYPAGGVTDGRFRRIAIRVARKGLTLQFRRGYYARPQLTPFDRRQFLTYSRIAAAGNFQGAVTDLKLRVKASKGDQNDLVLDVTILPDRVAFTDAGGLHAASIEVAFFCGDAKENVIGQHWQTIDLKLKDAPYQQFLREGASYTTRIAVRGDPKFVKAIVYDYTADLLGTTVAKVP